MTTPTDPGPGATAIPTAQLIAAMLKGREHVSDLIFSPGHARQIANDLMGSLTYAREKLEKEGATDLSYSIPSVCRFRVNIFRQRGTHAIVMRVIPNKIPTFEDLNLPPQLAEIVHLRNGIV